MLLIAAFSKAEALSLSNDAMETVMGTAANVEIVAVHLYDQTGHRYGADIYLRNHRGDAVRVEVKTTSTENVVNLVSNAIFIVGEGSEVFIGRVLQKDQSQKWEWNWKMNVFPDQAVGDARNHWYDNPDWDSWDNHNWNWPKGKQDGKDKHDWNGPKNLDSPKEKKEWDLKNIFNK